MSWFAASALALNFGIAFVATFFDLGVRSGLSASGFLGAAGAAPSVGSAARKIASASVYAEKAPRIASELIIAFVDSAKYLCGTTTSKERLSSHREPRSVEQRVPRPRRS